MGKFRKKPVEIEAVYFDGKLVGEFDRVSGAVVSRSCPEWFPAVLEEKVPGGFGEKAGDVYCMGDKIYIVTLEGVMTVSPGDWIIRGVQGELYPCKPAIFAATYEPA